MNSTVRHESAGPKFAAIETVELRESAQAPNFDGLAKLYRWMELLTFGPLLSRCRTAFLSEIAWAHRGVVLGDGDGRFTAELLRANAQVEIDAVDVSPAMIEVLLRRAGTNSQRVRAHCADAREWTPEDAEYDLVATHFFLDCLTTEECRALAAKVRKASSSSTVWIVSEFAVPEGRFGQFVAQPVVWLLYRGFGVLTGLRIRSLPDHHSALRDAGFALAQRRTRLFGLLASEMWRSRI
jgi:hypothetical protein